MSDLTVSLVVSRTELSLADLEVNDGVTYFLTDRFTPGPITWRRESVTSPYLDGEFTISRVREESDIQLAIDVIGTTQTGIQTSVQTLIDAFTQHNFTLTFTVEGSVWKWNCEAGDYALAFENVRFYNRRQTIAFTLPRHPVAVQGPF
jgi:hypothetical protein